MWLRDLRQLTTHLIEISSLLREQNSLLRELISAEGRIPQTPVSKHSQLPPPRKMPARTYSAADVHYMTPEARLRMDMEAEQRKAPWRSPLETLADLHADDAAVAALPTSDHVTSLGKDGSGGQ